MYLNTDGSIRFKDNSYQPEPEYFKTPRMEFNEAYETIKRVTAADPVLKTLFEELLRDNGFKPSKRTTSPIPLDPTAIQVSVWDNWMGDAPRKGQPDRWGLSIKVWVDDEIDFRKEDGVEWVGNAKLKDGEGLKALAAKLQDPKGRQSPISASFGEMIVDVSVGLAGTNLHGAPMTNKRSGGTVYADMQMMIADVVAIAAGDTSATCVIVLDPDSTPLAMPPFSVLDAAGKPLRSSHDSKWGKVKSTCVMQSRWANDSKRFAKWITG